MTTREHMIPVSIVIPTRNAGDTLALALTSIRHHAAGAEVIIVDAESTDDTLAVAGRFPDVVSKLISEPDRGLYDGMNKGLALATRTWLFIMGSDDELLEGFTDAAALLHDPSTFYYGRIWLRQHGHPSPDRAYSDHALMSWWPNHQALLAPTSIVRASGGFDLRYPTTADWVMHLRCWNRGRNWRYVGHIYCDYNERGTSFRAGVDQAFRRRQFLLYARHLSWRAVFPLVLVRAAEKARSLWAAARRALRSS
jgi:glycosyltransferase involved in cell wall biosynthesis